jgi:hypothetical protein
MTAASDEKWPLFNFFSVQGTGDSPTGPDLENRVSDQENGSPCRVNFTVSLCILIHKILFTPTYALSHTTTY